MKPYRMERRTRWIIVAAFASLLLLGVCLGALLIACLSGDWRLVLRVAWSAPVILPVGIYSMWRRLAIELAIVFEDGRIAGLEEAHARAAMWRAQDDVERARDRFDRSGSARDRRALRTALLAVDEAELNLERLGLAKEPS